jgi:endonuclease-8
VPEAGWLRRLLVGRSVHLRAASTAAMPEGPEIRRAADRLGDALSGERLEDVYFGLDRLRGYTHSLVGRRVERVGSRGKAMLIDLEDGLILYSHNQLYGRWYVRPRGTMPSTRRSLRVGLHTTTQSALLYSASDIEVLTQAQAVSHRYLSRLGPDVLDPDLTWREISRRLAEPAFRNRSLGALYLDQRFLAGLGNYLRSEILFFARLSPQRRARELGRVERNRLARETLNVTQRAYLAAGVTLPPVWSARIKRDGAGRSDRRFAVFARAGKPCRSCGGRVERIEVGGRRLYVCRKCQARPGRNDAD